MDQGDSSRLKLFVFVGGIGKDERNIARFRRGEFAAQQSEDALLAAKTIVTGKSRPDNPTPTFSESVSRSIFAFEFGSSRSKISLICCSIAISLPKLASSESTLCTSS